MSDWMKRGNVDMGTLKKNFYGYIDLDKSEAFVAVHTSSSVILFYLATYDQIAGFCFYVGRTP